MKYRILLCVVIVAILVTVSAGAATRNVWVDERTLNNGKTVPGHFRIDDFISFQYRNNNSFWTGTGDYSRQYGTPERDTYYQGKLLPEAEALRKERLGQ